MNVELLMNKCRRTVEGLQPLCALKTHDVTKSHAAKSYNLNTKVTGNN